MKEVLAWHWVVKGEATDGELSAAWDAAARNAAARNAAARNAAARNAAWAVAGFNSRAGSCYAPGRKWQETELLSMLREEGWDGM